MRWDLRTLGTTGIEVSPITLGGAPLGSMPENFGYEVSEDAAIKMVKEVLKSDIRTIDTSNGYSDGRSEERIGKALAQSGGLPQDVQVFTKVDPRGDDYSGPRVHQSISESSKRLGLAPLSLVYLHDPEFHDFAEMTKKGGAVDALVQARDSGEVLHIGLAGGDVYAMQRYLDLDVFEVLLVHNRWSVVDRSAGPLIAQAQAKGVAVVNAAVLGGGILADRTGSVTQYGYRPARQETLESISKMRAVCTRWGTDLATAAIRFSTRDSQIATTVVGISKVERIEATCVAATVELPEEFWHELETHLPSPEFWLEPPR